MNLKNIIPITLAKRDLMKLLASAESDGTSYVVTKEGRAAGVLMSVSEYEGLLETIEILSDPEAIRNLQQAQLDFKKGRTFSTKQVFSE